MNSENLLVLEDASGHVSTGYPHMIIVFSIVSLTQRHLLDDWMIGT